MRTKAFLLVSSLIFGICPLRAAEKHHWESAKVLSQSLNSQASGAMAAPIGNVVVALPIYRQSNIVMVETETHQLQWSEVGKQKVILPVNGMIQFYRDKNWFVVLDNKGKKHKFGLVGMMAK